VAAPQEYLNMYSPRRRVRSIDLDAWTPEMASLFLDSAAGTVFYDVIYTKKLTRVAAPSPRASLGRRTVCGRTEQLSAAGFEASRN